MNIFVISSPIGNLKITSENEFLLSIHRTKSNITQKKLNSFEKSLKTCLQDFFSGKEYQLPKMKLDSMTEFQQKCLKELLKIPRGKTISYGEIGKKMGDKNYARAVGTACAKNPIPLLIPCHRVVSANGPGQYSLGGKKIKQQLLDLELRN